ncbi:hypothetical protein Cgig2_007164 [Carnegiea gigantea]|uniref:Uncharacterized protein n=1 Tax=Carnegiea gigantea TaxID=171969 RepID=A0A9Q1JS94_9CARY|nr:hypothetical protein Cgig2_007164 [Carnegiea gigantea]
MEVDDEGLPYNKSVLLSFVDRLLRVCKVRLVEKFSLRCDVSFIQGYWECHESWVEHVIKRRKAKEVEIYLAKYRGGAEVLCAQVFNSEALQVLKLISLNQCVLVDPDDANMSLPILKMLHIWVSPLHWYPQLFINFSLNTPRFGEAFLGFVMPCTAVYCYGFKYCLWAPNLKRLWLSSQIWEISADGFVIDAPVLEQFSIDDSCFQNHILEGMSCLAIAKVNVGVPCCQMIAHVPSYFDRADELLQGLASVKFLYEWLHNGFDLQRLDLFRDGFDNENLISATLLSKVDRLSLSIFYKAANYIRETFKWHLRGAAHPSRPFPESYHGLCPYFDNVVAEEAARDFRIPEITLNIFYAVVELGIMSEELAEHLKSPLEGL